MQINVSWPFSFLFAFLFFTSRIRHVKRPRPLASCRSTAVQNYFGRWHLKCHIYMAFLCGPKRTTAALPPCARDATTNRTTAHHIHRIPPSFSLSRMCEFSCAWARILKRLLSRQWPRIKVTHVLKYNDTWMAPLASHCRIEWVQLTVVVIRQQPGDCASKVKGILLT